MKAIAEQLQSQLAMSEIARENDRAERHTTGQHLLAAAINIEVASGSLKAYVGIMEMLLALKSSDFRTRDTAEELREKVALLHIRTSGLFQEIYS